MYPPAEEVLQPVEQVQEGYPAEDFQQPVPQEGNPYVAPDVQDPYWANSLNKVKSKMGCKSSFDQQVAKERKAIRHRFEETVHVNIMLFGYKNQGKTTLAKYYLQEQEQDDSAPKYGSFKIEDSGT